MTRLTPEREQEIRAIKHLSWPGEMIQDLLAEIDALRADSGTCQECQRLRDRKDGAYRERNKCVVLLLRMALALGLKSGIAKHDPNDKDWEDDWRTVVYIDLPSGQISWHFHDSESHLLYGFPEYRGIWDGHSTELKYERVLNPGHLEEKLKAENEKLEYSLQILLDLNEKLQIFYDEHVSATLAQDDEMEKE